MASAESHGRSDYVADKAEICDNILTLHRSMPNHTVKYTTGIIHILHCPKMQHQG